MNLKDGGTVGFKYFKGTFNGDLELALRGYGTSKITVSAVDKATGKETVCGSVPFSGTIAKEESRILCDGREFGGAPGEPFKLFKGNVDIPFAEYALYFTFNGPAVQDFYTFAFKE